MAAGLFSLIIGSTKCGLSPSTSTLSPSANTSNSFPIGPFPYSIMFQSLLSIHRRLIRQMLRQYSRQCPSFCLVRKQFHDLVHTHHTQHFSNLAFPKDYLDIFSVTPDIQNVAYLAFNLILAHKQFLNHRWMNHPGRMIPYAPQIRYSVLAILVRFQYVFPEVFPKAPLFYFPTVGCVRKACRGPARFVAGRGIIIRTAMFPYRFVQDGVWDYSVKLRPLGTECVGKTFDSLGHILRVSYQLAVGHCKAVFLAVLFEVDKILNLHPHILVRDGFFDQFDERHRWQRPVLRYSFARKNAAKVVQEAFRRAVLPLQVSSSFMRTYASSGTSTLSC